MKRDRKNNTCHRAKYYISKIVLVAHCHSTTRVDNVWTSYLLYCSKKLSTIPTLLSKLNTLQRSVYQVHDTVYTYGRWTDYRNYVLCWRLNIEMCTRNSPPPLFSQLVFFLLPTHMTWLQSVTITLTTVVLLLKSFASTIISARHTSGSECKR